MSKEMCGEGPIASPIVVDHTRLRNEIFGTDSVPSKWIGPLFQWNNPVLTYSDKKKNPLIFNTIEVSGVFSIQNEQIKGFKRTNTFFVVQ